MFHLLFLAVISPAPGAPVDFSRDVQPIFEAHCIACHGPEKQKSGYRLDRRAEALAGGESGAAALVPGRPEASPLLQLVDGSNAELFMPPRKSDARPLNANQIATLRQWIAEGATWPESAPPPPRTTDVATETHWSFRPLRNSPLPEGGTHPIDAFIRSRLREHGLDLSPPADRRTLIRRLSFDLIGLPPTPAEMDQFADLSGSRYEALVDHLLASPHHGERWARHWLDVVHFGETHGYDKDKPRPNAWPYRDYVIRAFNADKPYARFIQEQIAGDVLFPGTVDGVTALGFIAAGPWDLIGHAEVPETKTDGKIARHLDRDDMVSNTINTFQSVTVHCAQCHDHKFDPISQRDYFALQAVFAALDRTDVAYYPTDDAMREYAALQRQQQEFQSRIDALEEPLRNKAGEAYTALSKRIDAPAPNTNPNAGPEFGYHSAISPVADAVKWVQVDLGDSVPVRRVVVKPCYDDFGKIGAGFGFPLRFKIEVSDDPEFRSDVSLLWRKHDATFMNDFPNPGLAPFETSTADDDGVTGRYVRITATKLAPRQNDFIFALAELEVFAGTDGPNLAEGRPVTAQDSIEAPPRWRKANLTDGAAPEPRKEEDRERLRQERDALLLAQADEETRRTLVELRQERAALPSLPTPQKVYAGGIHHGSGAFRGTGPDGGKPRPIHLLRRGDVKHPEEEVTPASLDTIGKGFGLSFALDSSAESESARRAALARWLTHPDNALTWRSIVNRVWQYHFGRGLVETPNDFGKMGAAPTHPELLDWLAVWFRDEARGSLKALHRLVVTSETYRQTSAPDAATMSRASAFDADNTLLWRQNRRRLEAEAIRDGILLAAGKLDLTMGGPSFQDFVIDKPQHSPHYEYHLADPEDPKIHRRSVYRFLVRSQQQPWMAALDCADPSMLVDRRNQTITPLQALAQLNNQLCVAMARHFADRVAQLADEPGAQIDAAYRITLQRLPSPEEREALVEHVGRHGLAHTCRLILNLNEAVFVD